MKSGGSAWQGREFGKAMRGASHGAYEPHGLPWGKVDKFDTMSWEVGVMWRFAIEFSAEFYYQWNV